MGISSSPLGPHPTFPEFPDIFPRPSSPNRWYSIRASLTPDIRAALPVAYTLQSHSLIPIRVVLEPIIFVGAMPFVSTPSTPNADLTTDASRDPAGYRRLRQHPLGTALHSHVGYSHTVDLLMMRRVGTLISLYIMRHCALADSLSGIKRPFGTRRGPMQRYALSDMSSFIMR